MSSLRKLIILVVIFLSSIFFLNLFFVITYLIKSEPKPPRSEIYQFFEFDSATPETKKGFFTLTRTSSNDEKITLFDEKSKSYLLKRIEANPASFICSGICYCLGEGDKVEPLQETLSVTYESPLGVVRDTEELLDVEKQMKDKCHSSYSEKCERSNIIIMGIACEKSKEKSVPVEMNFLCSLTCKNNKLMEDKDEAIAIFEVLPNYCTGQFKEGDISFVCEDDDPDVCLMEAKKKFFREADVDAFCDEENEGTEIIVRMQDKIVLKYEPFCVASELSKVECKISGKGRRRKKMKLSFKTR